MRRAIVAAVVLICSSRNAPLSASEFVALQLSCNYVGNKVVLVPTSHNRLHVVIGDREQKVIRTCAPGMAGRCRQWTVQRFDLLCGESKVSWRSIAEQLLNLTPMPARMGNALKRAPPEAWELRTLRAETGFAPVDELGARILSVADKPIPQSPAAERASDGNTIMTSEIADRAPLSPKFEPDRVWSPPKGADTSQLFQFQTGPSQSAEPTSQPPGMASASTGPSAVEEKTEIAPHAALRPLEEVAAGHPDVAEFNFPKGADSVSATNSAGVQMAVPDDPFKFMSQRLDGDQAARFLVALASTLLLTFTLLTIVRTALTWRKSVTVSPRAAPGGELPLAPEAEAEACRELMKQVATELMRASAAVNSLRGAPALQSALYLELDAIRRLLGFAPQTQGSSGEPEDWHRIKSQLITSLQGTQRIVGIAEAARTSFSFHPAALQVITTRLEAYAFLGVNASSSEVLLKKTVNALRQCWHPDLATDEEDRRLREIRIKQINVAWDLISRKQMSA